MHLRGKAHPLSLQDLTGLACPSSGFDRGKLPASAVKLSPLRHRAPRGQRCGEHQGGQQTIHKAQHQHGSIGQPTRGRAAADRDDASNDGLPTAERRGIIGATTHTPNLCARLRPVNSRSLGHEWAFGNIGTLTRESTVVCMVDLLRMFLAQAGEHVTLLLACMLLFAALDAALGIGAVLPGETGIVLAAVTLSDRAELLAAGVFVAALGAFLGDHVGFAVGRGLGARLGDTRLIKRLGRDRWEKARYYVAGRFWIVILARLLPGIRTLVAAAAGASAVPYSRFATACGVAALLWAGLWVVGGALIGNALLDVVERYALPALIVVAAALVLWLFARHKRGVRA
ncbi:DedA family protein [Corynebacterium diphtheriae]